LDVSAQLYLLRSSSNSVPGAAGTFGIDPVTGDPVGRTFPIMELAPNGSLWLLGLSPPGR